ncbi:MAG TPA: iron-sulfur cluster assembly accessory protein [Ignavibacteriales bacterium]|nr:iron-sulfur cluster assembly accessory protein [Ignavibacteriales bacterium]HOL80908.1 iron-sulfur cluster assembly accessory protein [Ignavibacteriales bacterium]HOM64643.1 iron-sulfur cluster assembly accessory protein [Ignavibacteriales bacterium]HPD66826.1 iron-sulfur cluster assembly accessory protein [Ignavibacteriales bacterium]HPP32688.1 iron-sulfur cluster assembly accessory protein [Ignavibacteriales bacterium]
MSNQQDILLTPKAIEEVKSIIAENNIEGDIYLRIGVKPGGCCGFNYAMGLDNQITPQDSIYEFDGLKVLLDGQTLFYVNGTTIDFKDDEEGRGFVFINPNEESGGCDCNH